MVLTDDNFSTIVKAVELGRGLYATWSSTSDSEMGALFGFITSFLGASILNILGGVPFLPLQTLWINFTTLLFQAIGLGYGKPADALMERKPRPPDRPILTRGLFIWLIFIGLLTGAGTLGVIVWAERTHDEATAHTMGFITFSLFALLFSIATKDERQTMFSLDTFADRTFLLGDGRIDPHLDTGDRFPTAADLPQHHHHRRKALGDLPPGRLLRRHCIRDPQIRAPPPRRETRHRPTNDQRLSPQRLHLSGRGMRTRTSGGFVGAVRLQREKPGCRLRSVPPARISERPGHRRKVRQP